MSALDAALEIAREAGALLLHYYERRPAFELKGDYDLVTAADRASEELIVNRLQSRFPTHAITGEESGSHDGSSDYRWYVDPLDGTTNFAHGFPVFNVTLALARAGELVAGVVYDPLRDEMFAAEKGGGAFLNNHRIHVSKCATLEQSLSATGFPSNRRHKNVNVHFYYQLAMLTHGVRRAGSAAIDLAYVACGRLDFFWEFGLKPWDLAAGVLLINEAGGSVTSMTDEPFAIEGQNLLADNGLLHEETIALFQDIFAGRVRVPLVKME